MKNFKATNVVAFDKGGQAIICHTEQWRASLDQKSGVLVLKAGKHKLTYTLATDALHLYLVDQKDEVSLGKTLGRMALTGIATNGFAHGKGVPGAVMDLAIRGAESNTVLTCALVMHDTTSVSFEASGDELKKFLARLPGITSSNAADVAAERFDKVARLKQDGERVLPEIDARIGQLEAQIEEASAAEAVGGDFNARDAARQRRSMLESQKAEQIVLRKVVAFELVREQSKAPGTGRTLKVVLGGLALLVLVVFVVYLGKGAAQRSEQVAKGTAVPTAPQTRPEKVQVVATPPRVEPAALAPVPAETEKPAEIASTLARASFDCAKAATRIEKLICNTPELGDADSKLNQAYRAALLTTSNVAELKKDQTAWRRDRRDQCADAQCVLVAYRERTAELAQ